MNTPFDVLPLVVGLTGHRDPPPEAEPQLRERFRDVLKGIQQRHPSMRLLVLSGLAAGADILAAEEATTLGIAVMGCLPLPQAEYERDFTPTELERFRRALARCWGVVVVGSPDRHEQRYVDVANFIAYYSHVLVAFWDGLPARGPGGTAQVVALRQGGVPDIVGDALVAYMPDVGPVIQIVTPRKDQPAPDDCFSVHAIYPERPGWKKRPDSSSRSSGEDEFEDAVTHLERFDLDLANESAPAEPNRLAALAEGVDAAANRLQIRTMRSLWSVYVAAGLAGAAQLVLPADGSFNIPSWAGIVARIAFLAIAFAVYAIAKRNDFENRYQDYRAIAEALRVQCAWWYAGLRTRLVEASYLQMQQSELEWIRLALRTAYLITGAADPDGSTDDAKWERWIDGQIQYYETVGKREEAKLQRARAATLAVAVLGGALSAVAAASAWALSHGWLHLPDAQNASTLAALAYWATMPVALGSMIAILIRFFEVQRGFGENARRYQLMFTVFDAARRRLRTRAEDPRKILEQLGHEALSEHAEWLILHRDRPLTFVHT